MRLFDRPVSVCLACLFVGCLLAIPLPAQKQNACPATIAPSATSSSAAPIAVADPVRNYLYGSRRHKYGSCLHAAVIDLLRCRGMNDQAEYWRTHFGGPANVDTVMAIADTLHLRHCETETGDEAFLDFCAANRLGAAIYWEADAPHDHSIVFCGYDRGDAILLGTNRPVLTRMPKADFLREWGRCDGGAFTILP